MSYDTSENWRCRMRLAGADTFAFLVRPRAGKERSFAIRSLAHGACAHELVEQSVAGGRFSVNGKPVMGGQTLETAGQRGGCAALPEAPMPAHNAGAGPWAHKPLARDGC